jgi:hypothetical protein
MASVLGSLLLQGLFFQPAELGAVIAVINLPLSILLTALPIPFWQSIKAVIYYDLLTQKEGLGLNLRDSIDNF